MIKPLLLFLLVAITALACKPSLEEEGESSLYEATSTGFKFKARLALQGSNLYFNNDAAANESFQIASVSQLAMEQRSAGSARYGAPAVIKPTFDLAVRGPDGDDCVAANAVLGEEVTVECYSMQTICAGVGGTYTPGTSACTCSDGSTARVEKSLIASLKSGESKLCNKTIAAASAAAQRNQNLPVGPKFREKCLELKGTIAHNSIGQTICQCRGENGVPATVFEESFQPKNDLASNDYFSVCKTGTSVGSLTYRNNLNTFNASCKQYGGQLNSHDPDAGICGCEETGHVVLIKDLLVNNGETLDAEKFKRLCAGDAPVTPADPTAQVPPAVVPNAPVVPPTPPATISPIAPAADPIPNGGQTNQSGDLPSKSFGNGGGELPNTANNIGNSLDPFD